ncbi:MAG: hypothetical protein QOE15_1204 [Acidimicrobiaceae bacterium]|nr:hypothetical protein [Acidimicrobiaceae bacterium]
MGGDARRAGHDDTVITGSAQRWAAVAIAAFSVLLPRPAPPAVPATGCPVMVDDSDPLVVAGAVATWLYCGPPAGAGAALSSHARRVLTNWAARNGPPSPAAVVSLAVVDPRTAPVVVYAVIRRAGDADTRQVVLTMFHRPAGGWAVDDLTVLRR